MSRNAGRRSKLNQRRPAPKNMTFTVGPPAKLLALQKFINANLEDERFLGMTVEMVLAEFESEILREEEKT